MTEAKGSEVVLLAGAKGSEVVLVEAKGSEVPANGSTSVSYEGGGSAGGPAVWLQGSAMPGGGGGVRHIPIFSGSIIFMVLYTINFKCCYK